MPKPLLVYDGNCKVCIQQKNNLQWVLGNRFESISFRESEFQKLYPNIPFKECEQAIQFINKHGNRFSGAEAIARILALRWFLYPAMLFYYIPITRKIWDSFYKWIAQNRF